MRPHIMTGPRNGPMKRGIPGATSYSSWSTCMRSLLSRLSGWLRGPKPRISCDAAVWAAGVRELERRTLNGQRESGAFLLGHDQRGQRRILEFVFYDDVDP